MRCERYYIVSKVKNGWVLERDMGEAWICDTLGEAIDQLDAEEKKFPNDE